MLKKIIKFHLYFFKISNQNISKNNTLLLSLYETYN